MCAKHQLNNLLFTSRGAPLLLVGTIVALSAMIASAIFLVWSFYLLVSNQSTIEFYSSMIEGWDNYQGDNNPYHMGSVNNINAVFGKNWWYTLLVPVHVPPEGDGLIYPMNQGRGMPLKELISMDAV